MQAHVRLARAELIRRQRHGLDSPEVHPPDQGNMRHDHPDSRPGVDEGTHQGLLDRPTRTRCVGAVARTALDRMYGLRSMRTGARGRTSGVLGRFPAHACSGLGLA
jgi:hypothetical protein